MEAPWQPNMSTEKVTIGHRLHKLGYHAAYQGKWHLSSEVDTAHKPVDAPLLKYRDVIETYGFDDFMGLGDLIDGPRLADTRMITLRPHPPLRGCEPRRAN